jgi:hypothetical protein
MTQPAGDEPVLFAEQGSSWWPALWAPIFAAIGIGVEATTGIVHWLQWLVIGIGLGGFGLVWASARRKVYRVELTTATLTQGREQLPADRIAAVTDVGAPTGAKILVGGWTVPRKTDEVPLRLDDGTVVLAWARDGEAFTEALRGLVEKDKPRPVE